MLILSRKQGEAILIDGGIRIVVLATDNGGVRLGIDAPREVGIVREEIVDRIAEENRRAGATPAGREWLASLKEDGDDASPEGTADSPPSTGQADGADGAEDSA